MTKSLYFKAIITYNISDDDIRKNFKSYLIDDLKFQDLEDSSTLGLPENILDNKLIELDKKLQEFSLESLKGDDFVEAFFLVNFPLAKEKISIKRYFYSNK